MWLAWLRAGMTMEQARRFRCVWLDPNSFLKKIILFYIFCYHLSPITSSTSTHPTPPCNHHTVSIVYVHEFFLFSLFYFLLNSSMEELIQTLNSSSLLSLKPDNTLEKLFVYPANPLRIYHVFNEIAEKRIYLFKYFKCLLGSRNSALWLLTYLILSV